MGNSMQAHELNYVQLQVTKLCAAAGNHNKQFCDFHCSIPTRVDRF